MDKPPQEKEVKDSAAAAGCNYDCSDPLPDACGNEIHEERLLDRQEKDDDQNWLVYLVKRERNLLIMGALLIVLLNTSTGSYVLYPFLIFSVWCHECCHAIACYLTGGYVSIMRIYESGGGATNIANYGNRGFVASAGYPGTAVTGCLLLLFRRTTLGPTIGTIGMGIAMLLSVVLWVGNTFGRIIISIEGVVLLLCGWKLPAALLDNLYAFLALSVSLNAWEKIRELYYWGEDENGSQTDANTVADEWGGDYRVWATSWLITSIVLTLVGIVFAKNAKSLPWLEKKRKTTVDDGYYVAQVV